MKRKLFGGGPPVTETGQAQSFSRRAFVLGTLQSGVAVLLAGRMGYIAIAQNERYRGLAESNRVQTRLIPPRRGWIVDRHGQPMAINRADIRVDLIPDFIEDKERLIAELTRLLGAAARGGPAHPRRSGARPGLPAGAGRRASDRAAILFGQGPRARSAGRLGARRLFALLSGGRGGRPSARLCRHAQPARLRGRESQRPADHARLQGRQGGARKGDGAAAARPPGRGAGRGHGARPAGAPAAAPCPTSAAARCGRRSTPACRNYAARRLGEESGSCVILDCNNGDILALASMPAYDPNSFSDGISHSEWAMMREDERHPLINKTLNALYPPGSTFKPAVAMALLEAGVDPDETVSCSGGYTLGSRRFGCLGVHGPMNLHRAIAKSCNTYFYTMGRRIGIERFSAMAKRLGLGQRFDQSAGGLAKLRHHPRPRLEAAPLPPGVEPGRHAQRRHRPGLCDPQSAPARGDGGPGRLGPRRPAAPRPRPLSGGAAAALRRGQLRGGALGDGRGRQRQRHRGRQPAAARRHPDGGQDRHRPGPQHRRRSRPRRRRTGAIATTACSSSSRRWCSRAMPARW